MIDLRAARSDPDGFRAALARRGVADLFNELLAADERWRGLVPQVDDLRSRQKHSGKPTPEQVEELKGVKEELKRIEDELGEAERRRDDLLLRVPNPPHESVPDGDSEEDAAELRRVGEPPDLADPKDHLELGRFEMERAARVSGSRFGYFTGDAARIALAVYRLALDRLVAAGFVPTLPPVLVRDAAMYGTGWFPTEKSNIYGIESDDLYLVGTSEVPVAGLHMGEILDADELPLRYVAFSTCFRREAGAAGKDTRGMIRVHQFNKVEQFVLCRPQDSWAEHERLLEHTEEIARELGLPYRIVTLPAGDMGPASAKTYDLELWFPAQGRYREGGSISNTTDYQARRLQIRLRGERGTEPLHTLNGTAVTDRFALAVLENYQRADGSVEVPAPLVGLGAPSIASR